jgi:hypothetical protein
MTARLYRLAIDGDDLEKQAWFGFLQTGFPAYEEYWLTRVVPLSERPRGIQLKSDEELRAAGLGDDGVCWAQLHYTVLRHLSRAFELLARHRYPGIFKPWKEGGDKGGQGATKKWQREAQPSIPQSLTYLRQYRNHLVHGRVSPHLAVGNEYWAPKPGRERAYLDWRKVTAPGAPGFRIEDFAPTRQVLRDAWLEVLEYLEAAWRAVLLAPVPATSAASAGEFDRTTSLGLHGYATEFVAAAETIADGPQDLSPVVYYLACHGIELALKAFLRGSGLEVSELQALGHDLVAVLAAADTKDLSQQVALTPADRMVIGLANAIYKDKQFEYIEAGYKELPQSGDLVDLGGRLCRGLERFCVERRAPQPKKPS